MPEQTQSLSIADILALMGNQESKTQQSSGTQVLGGTGSDNQIVLRIGFTDYSKDPKRVIYRSGRPSTIYCELAFGCIAEMIIQYVGLDPNKVEFWVGKDNILRISNKQGAGGSAEIINLK